MVATGAKNPSESNDYLRAEGEAPRTPVIDAHTHIFPPEIIKRREAIAARDRGFARIYGNSRAIMADCSDLLRYMEEDGVEVAVVCGFPFNDRESLELTNDYILHAAQDSERLIPLISVHLEDENRAFNEAERCFKLGARGIGEVALYEKSLNGAELAKLDKIAVLTAKRGGVLLLHMNEQVGHEYNGKARIDFKEVSSFITSHQDLRIILAHLGGGLCFYEFMPEIRKGFSGVFYDTAALPYLYSQEVYGFIERFLSEKILFGSDYPLLSFKRYDRVMGSLDERARKKILNENARKVFSHG